MTRFYLITGFLGAGKTSFLRGILPSLTGERVALIVNDFGREGVDAALLEGQGVAVSEIHNGSIFCACRSEQFREGVEEVLRQQPDLILTEASGLADPTNLNGVLERLNDGTLEYGGTVCLVDGARFHKVKDTALVVNKQLQTADGIILNKIDVASPEQLAATRQTLEDLCPGIPVLETCYGRVPTQWLRDLHPRRVLGQGAPHIRDITQQSLTLHLYPGLSRERLEHFLKQIAGATYRMKGFVSLKDGVAIADCVGDAVKVEPWTGPTEQLDHLTVLFGNGLPARKTIRAALQEDLVGELES